MDLYPDASKQPDKRGQVPLHTAKCRTVDGLLGAYPAGVKTRDKNGRMPLHTAKHRCIKKVLDAYSSAAKISDKQSLLPLHTCLKHSKECLSRADASFLTSANPGALLISDDEGFYPFAIAAISTDSKMPHLNVIYDLLRTAPEALAHSCAGVQETEEGNDDTNPPAKKRKIEGYK